MAKSAYVRDALLAWLRGTAMPAPPPAAGVYFSLHTADPGTTGAAEHGATASYGRKQGTFAAPAAGVMSNSANVEFNQATAAYSAGIVAGGAWDAASGGNFLGGTATFAAVTIASGQIPRFSAGAFTWTET